MNKYWQFFKNIPLKRIQNKFVLSIKKVPSFVNKTSIAVSKTSKFLLDLLIIVLFVSIIWLVYSELTNDTILIQPFEVPVELHDKGLSGRYFAEILLDQINAIKEKAQYDWHKSIVEGTDSPSPLFVPVWSIQQLDVKIPETGFSINSILSYIRKVSGHTQRVITGRVISDKGKLRINLHIDNRHSKIESGGIDELNRIFFNLAEHVYKYTRPSILASYYESINERDRSLKIIRDAISMGPSKEKPLAFNEWGILLSKERKYEEAIEKYQRALELDPDSLGPYINWGLTLQKKGKNKEAIEKYKSAIRGSSNKSILVAAYLNWGTVLATKKEFNEAISKYKRVIELHPTLSEPYINWGIALYSEKKYDEALRQYKTALEYNPNSVPAHTLLGLYYDEQEANSNKAIDEYEKAIELNPDYALVYYLWGNLLKKEKNLDGAAEKYQQAITADPYMVEAYINLSSVQNKIGNDNAAIEASQKAIALDAKAYKAHIQLGMALFNKGEYDKGISEINEGISLAPKNSESIVEIKNELAPQAYLIAKRMDEIKQDYGTAEELFEFASELNPNFVDAYIDWGGMLAKQNKWNEAQDKVLQAVQIDPTNVLALVNLGHVYSKLKNYEEAEKAYKKAFELDPNGKIGKEAQASLAILQKELNH